MGVSFRCDAGGRIQDWRASVDQAELRHWRGSDSFPEKLCAGCVGQRSATQDGNREADTRFYMR